MSGWQVGYSALLFYGYVGVIGLALFAALKWWFKAEVGLAQVWCTYGARPQHISLQCKRAACATFRETTCSRARCCRAVP